METEISRRTTEAEEMAAKYLASGSWDVRPGSEDEFVERWTEFLGWTRKEHPDLVRAGLTRDAGDRSHFVSFAEWPSEEARRAWKQDPGFAQRFGAARELCRDFRGGDFDRVKVI